MQYGLPPIIGLKGLAGAGKTLAAVYLIEKYGFARARFAGSLKAMLTAHLLECGLDAALAARMIDGDLKEDPSAALGGKTPRFAMQTLGTEWGRKLISQTLWTDATTSKLRAMAANDNRAVLDDCRFENERDLIRDRGGMVIELRNSRGASTAGGHASESQGFDVDYVVEHDGRSKVQLFDGIERALNAFTMPADRNPSHFAA